MKVVVVIVNYRTAGLVIDCLRSVREEIAAVGARVLITDNASGDDSINAINDAIARMGWSEWAQLMPLPKNGGFAYGNNAAIAHALKSSTPPDYIYLLNPDTLMKPGGIRE